MARCSGKTGIEILIEYLEDSRALLAEHAQSELTAITGHDLGKDTGRWRAWFGENGGKLKPRPWTTPSDPVASWDLEILVPAERAAGPARRHFPPATARR